MKKSRPKIFRLYLCFYFSKRTFFLLFFLFLLWALIAFLNTGFPYPKSDYIHSPDDFHQTYLKESLFYLKIIDGGVVCFLLGRDRKKEEAFDSMFLTQTTRGQILFAKLSAKCGFLFLLLAYEGLILLGIGLLCYPKWLPGISFFQTGYYLFCYLLEFLLLGHILSLFFDHSFLPIFCFFLYFVLLILSEHESVKEILSVFLPIFTSEEHEKTIGLSKRIIHWTVCLDLWLISWSVFQKKEI